MTEHDESIDVIDLLRAARPDELPEDLVSPHAPAAQALLEEILSMQTINPDSDTAAAETVAVPSLAARRTRRRLFTVGGLTAAGIAAALAAVTVVVDPVETSEAAAVETALTRSATSLDESGRVEVTARIVHEGEPFDGYVENSVDTWEYAAGNWSVTMRHLPDDEAAAPSTPDPINRYVDGELYLYIAGPEGDYRWFHDIGPEGTPEGMRVMPDTLLAELEPAGDFEEIATETIDGVTTRRLRASNPGDTPSLDFGRAGDHLGEVVSLEVWVDDEGLVRRLDLAFGGDEHDTVSEATISMRFSDFGEPITIEVPPDAEDLYAQG